MGDVNFPEHLDISPSLNPKLDGGLNNIFGSLAQQSAIEKYGIAGRVWEAAYMLNQYVRPSDDIEFDPSFQLPGTGSTILELGSGTGITSYCISRCLTRRRDILISTDLPEVCHLLEANLVPASEPSDIPPLIYVRPLAWGNEGHWTSIVQEILENNGRSLTHVICSDLIYFPELLAPLLRSLITVTNPPSQLRQSDPVTVIISYKIRSLSKETRFWQAFGLWFSYEPVLVREKRPEAGWKSFGSPDGDAAFIFVAHRRKESYGWEVPCEDKDLLAGRGAKGTNLAKSDDYFDSLLLMTVDDTEI